MHGMNSSNVVCGDDYDFLVNLYGVKHCKSAGTTCRKKREGDTWLASVLLPSTHCEGTSG